MSAPALVVPWVASWSDEPKVIPQITYRRGAGTIGIAYQIEMPGDRDEHDVLWVREPEARGHGSPQLGIVHARRQRSAMRELLCQVCGMPADVDGQGVLWLVEGRDADDDWAQWPEGLTTTHPPICGPCVEVSRRMCPHLRQGSALLRVENPQIIAVYGRRYLPGRGLPRLAGGSGESVLVDSLAASWVVASQAVAELSGCTVIDTL